MEAITARGTGTGSALPALAACPEEKSSHQNDQIGRDSTETGEIRCVCRCSGLDSPYKNWVLGYQSSFIVSVVSLVHGGFDRKSENKTVLTSKHHV